MFRKLILTLAAVAAVAATAVVTSNDAEAFPRGVRGPAVHRPVARPVIAHRPIIRTPHVGLRPIFRPRPGHFVKHHHPRCGWHHYRCNWYPHFRKVYVSPTYVAPSYVAPTYVAPTYTGQPGPCTCLSKQYLKDGSVLFKDNCTKESAVTEAR